MSQAGELNVTQNHPEIPTSFITNSGTATPIANELEILGTHVAAQLDPVFTTGSTNVVTINVQAASAQASSIGAAMGLASFDSTAFSVDANGFVTFSGSGSAETLTGNTGGPISPVANNINTIGSGSITIDGAGNTLTTHLTGLTAHAVQVGAAGGVLNQVGPTATALQVLQSAGAGADPAYSTATYPATTTINQILYSSSANVVAGLTTANRAVLTTGATGIPVLTALATDGQLIIGSTAGVPAASTLTAGTGISITNASNSITIAGTGGGFAWTDVTGATQTLAAQNGYVTDRGGGVTYTLPATGTLGDIIKIVGKAGLATVTPNANQQILIGSASGAVGATGTAVSNNAGDCLELICITAGASTVWRADSVVGTWTLN